MIIQEKDITGVILAGGMSSRMGRDKGMLMLEGEPFIKCILHLLNEYFRDNVISADSIDRYSFFKAPVIPDLIKDTGPLGGIHSVLSITESDYIFVVACDMPLIVNKMVELITDNAEEEHITVAGIGEKIQPLFGIYSKRILKELDIYLHQGKRRAVDFLKNCRNNLKVVDMPQFKERLQNVNTEEEYKKVCELYKLMDKSR